MRLLQVGLSDAVHMATRYLAEFLGLSNNLGGIIEGYRADLIIAEDRLNDMEVWMDGSLAASGSSERSPN